MNVVAMNNLVYNGIMTKIISKKLFEEEYKTNTQEQLARKYDVARTTIQNWARKHGLMGVSKRGGHNIINFCSPEELKELYLGKKLSSIEIGKKFGIDKSVVLTRLKKHGIKRRGASEARMGKYDG